MDELPLGKRDLDLVGRELEYVQGETDAGRVWKFPEGPDVVNVVRVQLVDAAVVEVQLARDAVATSGGVEAAELSSSAFVGYRPRPGPAPRARGRDLLTRAQSGTSTTTACRRSEPALPVGSVEAVGHMPIAEVNGVQLRYQRSGAGEPLVLVHGSWVDRRVWDRVVPLLSRSFEVVAYDRRGHSLSSCPPGQGSIRDDVDDLAALIDFLALGPAHVSGASWGGSIALRLVVVRPELLRSVTIHEPPLFDLLDAEAPGLPDLTELRARLATVAARLEAGDLEGAARLYFDQVAETPGGWAGLDHGQQSTLLSNALTYLDQCRDPDALGIEIEDLAGFGGPALLTHGDRRAPLFKRIVEMIVAVMPGARSELIPGAAHDPQVTHPGSYAHLIEDFAGVG
jgi:pimeloyl-ACP methyl ester carboxylesterase